MSDKQREDVKPWISATDCRLDIEEVAVTSDMKNVWKHLPPSGVGWIMYPDQVVEYAKPSEEDSRPFLALEVVSSEGGKTTHSVRFNGTSWSLWKYVESESNGSIACKAYREEYAALSERDRKLRPDATMNYTTYWRLTEERMTPDDEPLMVWRPFASRLTGRTT